MLKTGAVDIELSQDEIEELDKAYQPQAAFGHA